MKWSIIILTLFFSTNVIAQSNNSSKSKFRIWMEPTSSASSDYVSTKGLNPYPSYDSFLNKQLALNGLLQLDPSSILVSSSKFASPLEIPIENIESLRFRKKGATGKGILIGAAAGFLTGMIAQRSYSPDPPKANYTTFVEAFTASLGHNFGTAIGKVMITGLFTTSGAVIGGIIGGSKKKIRISGRKKSYRQQKKLLEKYLMNQ